MNLLAGMEKFGFSTDEELNILKEDAKEEQSSKAEKKASVVKTEKDFIIDKKIKCPVCDKDFMIKAVLVSKLKRLESDFDLRPNYEYIDKCKYDVISCPHCGYSALDITFNQIDSARIKLVRNDFCSSFKPQGGRELPEIYSYEYAAEKYKLALICTMKKRGNMSEKAYVCLKLAWIRRAQLKELKAAGDIDSQAFKTVRAEYAGFYKQAYEGLLKARATEMPPFCGMSAEIVEFMLANMAIQYKQYDTAMKFIGKLLQSPATSRNIKDKCLTLKDKIIAVKNNH